MSDIPIVTGNFKESSKRPLSSDLIEKDSKRQRLPQPESWHTIGHWPQEMVIQRASRQTPVKELPWVPDGPTYVHSDVAGARLVLHHKECTAQRQLLQAQKLALVSKAFAATALQGLRRSICGAWAMAFTTFTFSGEWVALWQQKVLCWREAPKSEERLATVLKKLKRATDAEKQETARVLQASSKVLLSRLRTSCPVLEGRQPGEFTVQELLAGTSLTPGPTVLKLASRCLIDYFYGEHGSLRVETAAYHRGIVERRSYSANTLFLLLGMSTAQLVAVATSEEQLSLLHDAQKACGGAFDDHPPVPGSGTALARCVHALPPRNGSRQRLGCLNLHPKSSAEYRVEMARLLAPE